MTASLLTASEVIRALAKVASPAKAKSNASFFKTGPGEYGEGDVFVGVTVPEQRKIARHFRELPLDEIATLLASEVHEHRLTALLILVDQYERRDATPAERQARYQFYLDHLAHVNNWDLVDSSARQIVGAHLLAAGDAARHPEGTVRENPQKPPRLLDKLARSKVLWERRVAIIASSAYINAGRAEPTLTLSKALFTDKEDLMHKAVGWMLREVGKRVSADVLRTFLEEHAPHMPRTALRYAIEHMSKEERARFLSLKPVKA